MCWNENVWKTRKSTLASKKSKGRKQTKWWIDWRNEAEKPIDAWKACEFKTNNQSSQLDEREIFLEWAWRVSWKLWLWWWNSVGVNLKTMTLNCSSLISYPETKYKSFLTSINIAKASDKEGWLNQTSLKDSKRSYLKTSSSSSRKSLQREARIYKKPQSCHNLKTRRANNNSRKHSK